ncbi:Crp/Fnr family transcriptional regulator [Peredibacter sp. HCB2-198]|uniref:Crp/Fnr family transcriptional regulator n=1 Tax=Peredibacter sp. HCB2-198 TaxID=3383025 RepID=UPI0038B4AC9E
MTTAAAQTKSGLKTFKPGEILFNDGDAADSLFIIQKGQIRLFKPKGKGFIEIAVLRSGEVIGEMAYFDEDGSGKKRSCSASAITPVEIIEISFSAFGKTMSSLNPWFKTIINTLVTRLRKSNARIRELEDNQASVSYSGKHSGYEFIKPIEVMRILGTLFLVFKAHGEVKGSTFTINKKTLNLYTQDLYTIMEVKQESVINILVALGWMEIGEDADKAPNILTLKHVELIRQVFIYYNSERHLPEEKKIQIGEKCQTLIAKMIERAEGAVSTIPNLKPDSDYKPKFTQYYNLTNVLKEFQEENVAIGSDQTADGKNLSIFGEVLIDNAGTMVEIDFEKMKKLYPIIRFMNAIKKLNQEKAPV